jgi:hypothetical protein
MRQTGQQKREPPFCHIAPLSTAGIWFSSSWPLPLHVRPGEGKIDESSGTSSEISIDMVSRLHYNTPAYRRYQLLTSRVADRGLTYERRTCFLILSSSRDHVSPSLPPFFGEAATPHPRLISSPGGEAFPYSTLILCLQHSGVLAKPASDAIATAAHASVKGYSRCIASRSASRQRA